MPELTVAGMTEYFRDAVLQRYGIDLTKAKGSISSRNMGFVFPDENYVLRINLVAKEKREILSEAFFVDYIKLFIDTICEPMPSLSGKLMEELVVKGKSYFAVKFKKAMGKSQTITQDERMTTICAGELLGKIHNISKRQAEEGFHFSRPNWEELEQFHQKTLDRLLIKGSALHQKAIAILNKARAVTKNENTYGLIHGDFDPRNMFRDYNNLWLFDFDDCVYHYFIYDIATYLFTQIGRFAAQNKITVRESYNQLLAYFLIGYRLNMPISDEEVALIPLFMMVRIVCGLNIAKAVMQEFQSEEIVMACGYLEGAIAAEDEDALFAYVARYLSAAGQ